MTPLEFRRASTWEPINNPELVEKEEKSRRSKRCRDKVVEHSLGTAPKFAKHWYGMKWELGSKKPYQKYKCSVHHCTSRIHAYCNSPHL